MSKSNESRKGSVKVRLNAPKNGRTPRRPRGVNATKLVRRRFLHFAAGTAALPAAMRLAWAQAYPTRPIRIIVGFPPGGATDITARLIGQSLSDQLGKPFIIENRSGASGNLAAEAVVNAAPDGYTLLLVNAGNVINSALYEKLNFNFLRDIAPVGSIVRLPLAMMVHPSVPATTVQEFIAYAKGKSAEISIASAGNGSSTHLSGEMFKMMTGVNMVHVPYRGEAPAITDLLGGQVQVMFVTLPASIEYIRAGRLRALAVTTAKRFEVLPNLPTVGEFVPGFEASGWQGIGVPKNTSADIIDKLNKSINAVLGDAKIKARFADLGGTVFEGSPADFGKFIADETEKWAKVVKFSGAKAD